LLIAGSVELGTVNVPASRTLSLELPENVIGRLEAGWAMILPICEPCFPSDPRCAGFQYHIERLWIVGV
jgi:hypothetical protein